MTENLAEQLALLPEYFRGHLALTLISLIIGITISIPLGVWAAQAPRVKRPLLTLVSIIQTFPSVAILALVVAMLGGRIGSLPAIIALVLYSMLPIVRNTVTGLENVAEEVVTAARGIGMSPRQILTKVRIPLALPVIIAGIRTAAVWTVGLATLSTLVGAAVLETIFLPDCKRGICSLSPSAVWRRPYGGDPRQSHWRLQWLAANRNAGAQSARYRQ